MTLDLSKSYEYFQPEKVTDKIHIIGCGSVGSNVAEMLVRSGITNLTLWDFDEVCKHNVANQLYRNQDIGIHKVRALKSILTGINPDVAEAIELKIKGWNGENLSGYVFMCVDSIDLRREIVKKCERNPYIKGVFDFRTGLENAQHYAADWKKEKQRKELVASMNFTSKQAKEATPVSACGTVLGVNTTVKVISAIGVSNFVNFIRTGKLKTFVSVNLGEEFNLDAFTVE